VSDDLVTWLRAQLDDDERIATDAANKAAAEYATADRLADNFEPPYDGTHWTRDYDHIFVVDPRPARTRKVQIADCGYGAFALTPHIARHDPARVLREIDAKRQLLTAHAPGRPKGRPTMLAHCQSCTTTQAWDDVANESNCLSLRLLALPYADRSGYREEWRP